MIDREILLKVKKPARYAGGEANMVVKDKPSIDLSVCFCFPDTYEIGMSHLGLQILYGLMNSLPYVWCERAFAPWADMEELLRRRRMPLSALESGDSLARFDVLAFTLQYELTYTNVLNMLDLAGIPVRADERGDEHPLVIAGGPCAANPEPLADFIDLFVIGDGEEVTVELMELFRDMKGAPRRELLKAASKIKGVYVPSLYEISYFEDGRVKEATPLENAPNIIEKRVVTDLDSVFFPDKPLVPNTEIVHERVMLELFRGCIRGCRFCQAGYATRPVRSRSPQKLIGQGIAACKNTGYEDVALTSLSSSDYRPLRELCDGLLDYCEPKRIGLSLPSLRADSFSTELMERVQKVRKSGLTFAPEAGSARLRDVINKNLTEKDLLSACAAAFSGGWNGVKLYFMLGLPTETDQDALEIAELCSKVYQKWRQTVPDRARGVRITASSSFFVPKPHTPFQWEPQDTREEFQRKAALVKGAMRRQITYNWHDPDGSVLEGALARGDRRVGAAIENAWRQGARLDGWGEFLKFGVWRDAFESAGLDMAFYAHRRRELDETLPWSHISLGVNPEHLKEENRRAHMGVPTPDCRTACAGCGANLLGGECGG